MARESTERVDRNTVPEEAADASILLPSISVCAAGYAAGYAADLVFGSDGQPWVAKQVRTSHKIFRRVEFRVIR